MKINALKHLLQRHRLDATLDNTEGYSAVDLRAINDIAADWLGAALPDDICFSIELGASCLNLDTIYDLAKHAYGRAFAQFDRLAY